jgi:hypothetical protein
MYISSELNVWVLSEDYSKNTISWNVTLYILVDIYQRFGWISFLSLQGMAAYYQILLSEIPEDHSADIYRHKILEFSRYATK